ncbi:MAG TPA: CPXCG motif-containing cysteine-rich protein, partial [Candidatus Hydrogenedentes bacterium]|nr:CPXCG motif-containing cysteine-rich protein [Candidatus Hydrogenedentota bacterium]
MEEYFFMCPYCGQQISMMLDLSVRGQKYIEDGEVCCRPIEISYSVA